MRRRALVTPSAPGSASIGNALEILWGMEGAGVGSGICVRLWHGHGQVLCGYVGFAAVKPWVGA